MNIVIAKCPKCGIEFYGFSEEEATEKYYKHSCPKYEIKDTSEIANINIEIDCLVSKN